VRIEILSPVAIRGQMHRDPPLFIAEPEVGRYRYDTRKPNA
jgi:hypothetical protein